MNYEVELLAWESEVDSRAECEADLMDLPAGWSRNDDGSLSRADELAEAA